jgi:hypothetical protein
MTKAEKKIMFVVVGGGHRGFGYAALIVPPGAI